MSRIDDLNKLLVGMEELRNEDLERAYGVAMALLRQSFEGLSPAKRQNILTLLNVCQPHWIKA